MKLKLNFVINVKEIWIIIIVYNIVLDAMNFFVINAEKVIILSSLNIN